MSDLGEELVDCARYGELEEVEALLKKGALVNYQDEGGNTALHKACANNHIDVVRALLAQPAQHLTNKSGNTPLHWAVQSKSFEIVKLLLAHFPDIDVLQQNSFGRSCLTDSFDAENQDTLTLLLTHKSAKKLEDDSKKVDNAPPEEDLEAEIQNASAGTASETKQKPAQQAKASDAKITQTMEHKFVWEEAGPVVRVREVGTDWIGESFGAAAEDDITGVSVWAAALIMSRWLVDIKAEFNNKTVCELGAGCGLPGLTVYAYSQPSKVVLTDFFKHTLDNLRFNADLNKVATNPCELSVAGVDWLQETTWPAAGQYDVILGCDLIYDVKLVNALTTVIRHLLAPNGVMYYVFGHKRNGAEELIDTMGKMGFKSTITTTLPPKYFENPLVGVNDGDLLLHFNELADNTFSLVEFRPDDALMKRRAELEALVKAHKEQQPATSQTDTTATTATAAQAVAASMVAHVTETALSDLVKTATLSS